ncbi:MAG: ferrochelatase [Planctomycetota bacterium]
MSEGVPIGVVPVNLGTPDAPTPAAVRRFLREFLRDPCVVEANRLLWWLILHLVILPRRPRRVAALYRSIWTKEGSPLLAGSRRLAAGLERELGATFAVRLGMRVGSPSLAAALSDCVRLGCRRVVVLPLYPQYSRSTTGSVERHLADLRRRHRYAFETIVVPPFFADDGYIGCVAAGIRRAAEVSGLEHVVFSFHGLPLRSSAAGDPYADQCRESAVRIAAALGLAEEDWTLVYQSRFGAGRWLEPQAIDRVPALARRHPRLVIAGPGFVIDCLETLHEIGVELRAAFRRAGGEELRLVPSLGGEESWIRALARLVRRQAGTPDPP